MNDLERAFLLDLALSRLYHPADESSWIGNVLVLKAKNSLYPLQREVERFTGVAQNLEQTDGYDIIETLGCQEVVPRITLAHVKNLRPGLFPQLDRNDAGLLIDRHPIKEME